jgi:hypothetical protein
MWTARVRYFHSLRPPPPPLSFAATAAGALIGTRALPLPASLKQMPISPIAFHYESVRARVARSIKYVARFLEDN